MAKLAVIIITRNEAENIRKCLASVTFADSVHVLDSASTDDTVQIARSLGANVSISPDWPGFGVQKNRALAMALNAGCDWVLSLDADEQLSDQLQDEIKAVLLAPLFDVYAVSRLSSYCGRVIYYSGWQKDVVIRLFRCDTAQFSEDIIHEKVVTKKPVGQLQYYLLHESFKNLELVLDKVNRYSTAGALTLKAKGKNPGLLSAVFHGLWAFFRTYVLRLGFMDGKMGFILAVSNAEGTYYRYLKCWLMLK